MENKKENLTIEKILTLTTEYFKKNNIETAQLDAEILLAYVLNIDRVNLFSNYQRILTEEEVNKYRNIVLNRAKGMPVAYITGEKEFYNIRLKVNENVLIPRPETELLVEIAINYFKDKALQKIKILDIGTGSGNISIALAKNLTNVEIYAVDINENALNIVYDNIINNGLLNKIYLKKSDLFDYFKNSDILFDLIISNPPYISESEISLLPKSVINYEPYTALIAGKEGIEIIEKILHSAYDYLNNNGLLLLEISPKITNKIINLLTTKFNCYKNYEIIKDYSQLDRVLKIIKE